MITIKKQNNMTWISAAVTEFTSMAYCEYKIPLLMEGIKAFTPAMERGTVAHEDLEKYEQEHVKMIPVSIEEIKDKTQDIEFAREVVRTSLFRRYSFSNEETVFLRLNGKIDKILRKDGTLIVEDDKFVGKPHSYDNRSRPYDNQLLQALTYLNSSVKDWGDISHMDKRWVINIYDGATGTLHKTFTVMQDLEQENFLEKNLEKFARIIVKDKDPVHHNIKAKCTSCDLRDSCSQQLI